MHTTKGPKRPDSTTIFVSLALAMLVLFSYLNALSLPSERLLHKALPQNKQTVKTESGETEFPPFLKTLVVYSTSKTLSYFKSEPTESLLLIDRRRLAERAESGRTNAAELSGWLRSVAGNVEIEVTCFLPNVPTPAVTLAENLQTLQSDCQNSAFASDEETGKIRFFAQQAPARVAEKLREREIKESDAILLSFSRNGPVA